jgi:hypothetical protein
MRARWLVLLFFAGQALAGTTSLSIGADYTSGDYGSGGTTEMLVVPVTLKHANGPWIVRASLPYVWAEGSFSSVAQGPLQGKHVEAGLGDATVAAFYNVLDTRGLAVDLGAKAKLATADRTKVLITSGENDYSLQVDLFRSLPSASLFASLGYTFKGDSAEVNYHNPLYGALGLTLPLPGRRSLGAAWDYRRKTVAGGSELSELTVFYSQRLDATDKVQVYAVHGLADGSPDFGAGLVLTRSF